MRQVFNRGRASTGSSPFTPSATVTGNTHQLVSQHESLIQALEAQFNLDAAMQAGAALSQGSTQAGAADTGMPPSPCFTHAGEAGPGMTTPRATKRSSLGSYASTGPSPEQALIAEQCMKVTYLEQATSVQHQQVEHAELEFQRAARQADNAEQQLRQSHHDFRQTLANTEQ